MIKELKYFLFIVIIIFVIFFTFDYYTSDTNKKKSYRLFKDNHSKILEVSKNLILLNNDTKDIIEYVKKSSDKNKKNYNFWDLINTNE
ncbi:hypothetical protein OAS96_01675 [Candidatus Pelagibacter sp.]|jgi:hypothetical protein|nr:hypothetical protein [Candidatus Pelagibacter sp.]|tara:strand:+ start:180 stop:443 length:264 start_codon:yes stop_codon:yes gene_type:complete